MKASLIFIKVDKTSLIIKWIYRSLILTLRLLKIEETVFLLKIAVNFLAHLINKKGKLNIHEAVN